MILAKVAFPVNKAKEVASVMAEKGFINVLSWSKPGDGFFTEGKIHMFVAAPDEAQDSLKANLGLYMEK